MNPYKLLEKKFFWKLAIANHNLFNISDLWSSKFPLDSQSKIVTFGSCFAQHISTALRQHDFSWLNTEPSPEGIGIETVKKFNYDIFSSRTGNIYTTSLLLQWTEWALGIKKVPQEQWQSEEGRFYDPFRPNIEPNGFCSAEEVLASRSVTIGAFKQAILQADYFIFTLGLTESWFNKQGYEYPMCPGTVAGEYDENEHQFKNQQFELIQQHLLSTMALMREANQNLKFILTVSPIPLTATQSGNHVLVATMESKSILRAVAGQLATNHDFVDYFPSYEIINSPVYKGIFFEPNQRQVSPYGVNYVMDIFFKGLAQQSEATANNQDDPIDEACEEALLEAFTKK